MTSEDQGRPEVWVIRHGPTEWSAAGRHTGRTDIALTELGEQEARSLHPRLAVVHFDLVLASPLQRAARTAELAGLPDVQLEPLAQEWDYGSYEGLTRAQIRETVADWSPWSHPQMPDGESLLDVARRADAVLDRVRAQAVTRAVIVAHGHFLRIMLTRWIGAPATLAGGFELDPATVSVLGWDRGSPVVTRWNAP